MNKPVAKKPVAKKPAAKKPAAAKPAPGNLHGLALARAKAEKAAADAEARRLALAAAEGGETDDDEDETEASAETGDDEDEDETEASAEDGTDEDETEASAEDGDDEEDGEGEGGKSATAPTLSTGAVAERKRIAGILRSDAAKGREAAAMALAFDTDVTAKQAVGILQAMPVAKAGGGLTQQMRGLGRTPVAAAGGAASATGEDAVAKRIASA